MTYADTHALHDRIAAAITNYQLAHGFAPSVRDLVALLDLSSTSVLTHHLRRMKSEGRVLWEPGKARSLRVVEGDAVRTRTCTRCGQTKALSEFYRNGDHYRMRKCKACHNDLCRQYKAERTARDPEWAAAHRARMREYERRKRAERAAS